MRYILDRGDDERIKTVSDYVTPQKVNQWEPGDTLLIFAPTGAGKSYFVKNTLRNYLVENGLKCLYLLSRAKTKEQFQKELPNDSVITFATYQTVEMLESSPNATTGEWDMIVADECHYFHSDSSFNHRTDISFEWILRQKAAIRVFMTATYDGFLEDLERRGVPYTAYVLDSPEPKISSLQFFWSDAQLDRLADQVILSGEKAVFFIQSAKKAYDLYSKYKNNGLFICSAYNKELSKHLDKTLIAALLENERFDCCLLITTTALDTGVNIKDRELTTIVTDVTDPTTIVQCVGRKRLIDKDERLDLIVRARSNQQIAGVLRKQREYAKTIYDFLEHGAVAYNANHDRSNDSARLVFDCPETDDKNSVFTKRVNWLKYAQIKNNIRTYETMLKMGNNGYIKYIAEMFGCKYSVLEDVENNNELSEYLESLIGCPMLTKDDREPLIERLNIRRNGRLCKTSNVLTAWLESSDLPYRLHEYTTSRIMDGSKKKSYRAWEIVKLTK